ncbi:MAG TPA: MFS transporter, partial [Kofleriaceae bacterium]|nr:MFS transporter [Kofleriaceae bacterium]
CNLHIFPGPWTKYSPCDNAKDFLTKQGLSFTTLPAVAGEAVVVKIGEVEFKGWDKKTTEPKALEALKAKGFSTTADKSAINKPMIVLLLFIMVIYVTMVYGPIAAYLVELFPTRIRYTSMSLPYHIGNGWFGGMLPLVATAMMSASGNIYRGLWYPIVVSVMTIIVGAIFLRDRSKDFNIHD